MNLLNIRLLQIIGLIIAIVGLAGYWLAGNSSEAILTPDEITLFEPDSEEVYQQSFLIAGRDKKILGWAGDPIYDSNGRIIGRENTGEFSEYGTNTDTIIYLNIIGNEAYMVFIPRDIYLDEWLTLVNSMYHYRGAEGLADAVSDILNLPIDHFAIINIDIFEKLVDDLGGVYVNVPYDMKYDDFAADLHIDLDEGAQWLDGEQAAGFVRFRHTREGDIDRIDNIKALAFAMLKRVQQLNIRTLIKLDDLAETYFEQVETDMTLAMIAQLAPRLANLELKEAVTIPTYYRHDGKLDFDPVDVEWFLAQTFGGSPRDIAIAPDTDILITNRSGIPRLEESIAERLVTFGVEAENITMREASTDPTTRVISTSEHWKDGAYYASLFHVGQQQVDRLVGTDGIGLELVLGEDASFLGASIQALGGN